MPKARKPGDCACPCHPSGMTGALGPCGWCRDLHRPKVRQIDGCWYVGRWELVNGTAVYEPCQKCGQDIAAPIHNDGKERDGY